MSSDFERLLREAREGLPGPEARVTEATRASALAALRVRRSRFRRVALLATALVVAAALGVGVGTLIAPSSTAARGPVGLGFLPAPGWYALQSSARATETTPATAMASNVPFHPDDDVRGAPESSALPYATLLTLPPNGIVITASFTTRASQPWLRGVYPDVALPLTLSDIPRENRFGSQVRPEEPLGHHHLRGAVNDHYVELHVYFGTPDPPRSVRREAQRQLDRLVVRAASPKSSRAGTAARPTATSTTPGVLSDADVVTVDHTLVCAVRTHGGIYEVEARAHAGYRVDARWAKLPYATVTSGGAGGSLSGNQVVSANALAWMTAGAPDAQTTVDSEFWTFTVQASGTIGYNRTRCKPTSARVPLTRDGLQGGAAGPLGEERDCATPRRVLLRLRARLQSQSSLRKHGDFRSTNVPILDARMSMRTLAGKPLLYAEVFQSGKTPLYTAGRCVRD